MAQYTVQVGDNLWDIAQEFYGDPLQWTHIAELNGISTSNPIITVGQVLELGDVSSPPPAPDASTISTPTIQYMGVMAGTTRTVYLTWTWSRDHTAEYKVKWFYDTVQGIYFVGGEVSVTAPDQMTTFDAPESAVRVKAMVMAVSETYEQNNQQVNYWTCGWSSEREYLFSDNPPQKPDVPTVTIDKFQLTARLDNITDTNVTEIQFEVVKDDTISFAYGTSIIVTSSAEHTFTVDAGGRYKVRCRGGKGNNRWGAEWSDYSENVGTIPTTPQGFLTCRANSSTSVLLGWGGVATADTYDIEYATERDAFDMTQDTTVITGVIGSGYEVTGLEPGGEYFFRVRAVNDQGESGWSIIVKAVVGKTPSAPTTWSSLSSAIVGEPLTLYWVHNSEDGSKMETAQLEISVNGSTTTEIIQGKGNVDNEEEEETTYSFSLNTSIYSEGAVITWRVRTSGITREYGDWSITRSITLYAPANLTIQILNSSGNDISTLTSFPFRVKALATPKTQAPIGYHISIVSNSSYETVDQIGNPKYVSKGDEVFSRYYDINTDLDVSISAGDVDLENNVTYTIEVTVSMNSGLTASKSKNITVKWTDLKYVPNAELSYDKDRYCMYIRPFCANVKNQLVSGVTMSVYRREYDGSFTLIAENINNNKTTFVTDPHPALDYARYRIVATTVATGSVSYYDMPGYPVQEKAIILQWAEYWSSFDTTNEDAIEQPPWSGSLLRLPYNIDVSDSNSLDVELVEYIGRKHPVSYYGTQLGTKATWSMDVPKSDIETLYALRRLAIWTGDVYVREPSGSGYWSNISVSFNRNHTELVMPVSLELIRVEGGI